MKISKFKFQIGKGFTLVELSLYMGLMSVAIFVLTEIFLSVLSSQLEQNATSVVDQDGKYIVLKLSYDLGHASSIVSPTLGATASASTIVVDGTNFIYSIDSNRNLNLHNNLGDNTLNSYGTSVSNLVFKRIGNVGGKNDLQVKFTLISRIKRNGGIESKDYQTTVGLR